MSYTQRPSARCARDLSGKQVAMVSVIPQFPNEDDIDSELIFLLGIDF